ncbi:antibiotic biosynthesis monooxygenase [Rhodoferax sediminis]|uniref:Antibiotic biosynthesis monooxygenase n=2 Tax=Rhodoferax sediminis TaxID=2509614 RepID=A0A515DHD8_9BURK|nr:antibiotic biosynthesis monooxygenase [Rhodoferax sediminis]QDL39846.1 antibiotic biosynthesis monooxygenase [Rhodoferax sediminis]
MLEVAEFRIRPGEQAAFEEAIERALRTITAKAAGMKGYRFLKGFESAERYILQVTWEKLEDHMVTYRQSPERDQWRAIVSPFYAQPPLMEHLTLLAQS